MRNEEKLYLAIGEIDDGLIEEAGASYKKPFPVKKIVAAAACVVLVTVAAIGVPNMFNLMDKGGNMEGDMAPGMNGGSAGFPENGGSEIPKNDVIEGDIGRLTLLESNGASFTFLLNVYLPSSVPIDIYLESIDGIAVYTTAENVTGASVYRPTVLVDGEVSDRLPGEIGEYEVTISFDGIDELDVRWKRYFTVYSFGPFEHGLDID